MTRSSLDRPEPHCNRMPEDVKGFEAFLEEYKRLLPAEKAAVAAK